MRRERCDLGLNRKMEESEQPRRLRIDIDLERRSRMNIKKSIKLGTYLLVAIATLASVSFAGGFQLEIQAPTSNEGEMKGAALLIRTYGCHQPWDADVSATAEGVVNGKRQSLKVALTRTSQGVYAIKQQWPSQGEWVVAITGQYNGITSSALVELGANGKVRITKDNRVSSRIVQRRLTTEEIDSALRGLVGKAS